ncbi:hypothetical protein GOZ97_21670 [Agrobacterium vitis]|uniref:Uncharacterized protein n=1 Tax=Agrobacterium vitis TaxID=373 RepID=A0ABD6HGI2_AGRVI|nr:MULTISPECIES: hypothetical protein [Rhizobium/Agrobacterium group]MUO31126.1 hypothetical protein [Agrobacterium vitis]MUO44556.1 hypothetical protein [Agrobacterium vitis]MUO91165.1 hypothetical protein [Agrobacterium vitis]MUP12672.1 hypothetical protein [Agrobacterium vitis]MUZ55010.1 hypothetical protein [Agrobacterium vitis]
MIRFTTITDDAAPAKTPAVKAVSNETAPEQQPEPAKTEKRQKRSKSADGGERLL